MSTEMNADESGSWVLLVDDEAQFVRLVASKLVAVGFKAQTCGTLVDAFQKLKNQKFECILLDIRLEYGSGERIIDALRSDKLSLNFRTPIFLMSGYVDVGLIRRTGNKISGAFVKPFDTEVFVSTVCRVVAEARAASEGVFE